MKENIVYKPPEEKIYPRPSLESWSEFKQEQKKEEKKAMKIMLYGFFGFVIGCIWIILLSSLWGGEWVEVYDHEIGELSFDFVLDKNVFLVTGIVWLLFALPFIYHLFKNKKK